MTTKQFCADDIDCATQDCPRRLTNEELENLKDSLVPVSWAMYKEVCGKYDPIK